MFLRLGFATFRMIVMHFSSELVNSRVKRSENILSSTAGFWRRRRYEFSPQWELNTPWHTIIWVPEKPMSQRTSIFILYAQQCTVLRETNVSLFRVWVELDAGFLKVLYIKHSSSVVCCVWHKMCHQQGYNDLLGVSGYSQKAPISFLMPLRPPVGLSICLHVLIRLPPEGFLGNLVLGTWNEICRENIGQISWRTKYVVVTCDIKPHKSTLF
jgi:hypothetical protein